MANPEIDVMNHRAEGGRSCWSEQNGQRCKETTQNKKKKRSSNSGSYDANRQVCSCILPAYMHKDICAYVLIAGDLQEIPSH